MASSICKTGASSSLCNSYKSVCERKSHKPASKCRQPLSQGVLELRRWHSPLWNHLGKHRILQYSCPLVSYNATTYVLSQRMLMRMWARVHKRTVSLLLLGRELGKTWALWIDKGQSHRTLDSHSGGTRQVNPMATSYKCKTARCRGNAVPQTTA